ncbi:Phosphoglucomutase [Chlamydiales bacterium SCGC AB-751-O23]|jgi:phosphomannomutase|nr:Phosphoglucomutase [Chlamydiales bacterium SCGC AB-751-O23]
MSTPFSFSENSQKNLEQWLGKDFDEITKKRIQHLKDTDPKYLEDCFDSRLEFGTGGLRAVVDVGTNRMNLYTISMTTQGICNYLAELKSDTPKKVVIAYDSRLSSYDFACQTAKVFAANNIHVVIFKELRPLPLLSFACREEACDLAVMITASHNPPEYNGYKVFWSDGAQILSPHDKKILEHSALVNSPQDIKQSSLDDSLITWVDKQLDHKYFQAVSCLSFNDKQNQKEGGKLKIVYTPLHGAGATLIPGLLKQKGFTNLKWVEEQRYPDGNFPTVNSPNPEEDEALELGKKTLESENADILIATDPDSDRLAVVVKHENESIKLDGNESATIMAHYILSSLSEQNSLPNNGTIIKSLVTTSLIELISKDFGVNCLNVLTGFKYIGQKMTQWEKSKEQHFLFGAEESYGYLLGQHIRDKDAVICAALIAEIALSNKLKDRTLVDYLHDLYRKYGLHVNKLYNLKLESGQTGLAQKDQIMEKLRLSPPLALGGKKLLKFYDYQESFCLNKETDEKETLDLPSSNMLRLEFSSDITITVRPSGTEPKLKFYFSLLKKDCSSVKNESLQGHDLIEKLWSALNFFLELKQDGA